MTKDFTLFAIRDSRKADAAKKLLGENFAGVATSDRYAGYDWIGLRQLRWGAHQAGFPVVNRSRRPDQSDRRKTLKQCVEAVSPLASRAGRDDRPGDAATKHSPPAVAGLRGA